MNGSTEKIPLNAFWGFVDVRDLGTAHLRAYEHPEGGRFLITAGNYTYKQVVQAINSVPEVDKNQVTKIDESQEWPEVYGYDASKSKKELGLEYIGIEKCIQDMAKQLVEIEKRLGK